MITLVVLSLYVPRVALGATAKPVVAEITRDGANWTVEYRLTGKYKMWGFSRTQPDYYTGKSWRLQSWAVLTKGVRIAQLNGRDVLIADKGYVPEKVTILFIPWTNDLNADYDPALQFSTGDIALFDAHFTITPYDAKSGLADSKAPQVNRFIDKGRSIWMNGKASSSVSLSGDPTYLMFGDLQPVETERLQTIIDPGMPAWLKDGLNAFVPRLVDDFAVRFGVEGLDRKPAIWAIWGGVSTQGISTGGSVLPGFITAVLKGNGLAKESKDAKERLYWFLAHEVAHFWLGQRAGYDRKGGQWISEGGANAAAMLYLKATLPDYDYEAEFAEQDGNCRKSARQGAIRDGYKRGDFKGYYACGALFNLIADNLAKENGSDFFGFNGALIKQADASDKEISGEEWLEAFKAIAKDPELSETMVRILDGTSKEVDNDVDLIVARAKPAAPALTVPKPS